MEGAGFIGKIIKHEGVKVTTNQGNSYLIHNAKGSSWAGPTVTEARHMSSAWKTKAEIPVCGKKTVGGALAAQGPSNSHSKKEYWDARTCWGGAMRSESYIKKK